MGRAFEAEGTAKARPQAGVCLRSSKGQGGCSREGEGQSRRWGGGGGPITAVQAPARTFSPAHGLVQMLPSLQCSHTLTASGQHPPLGLVHTPGLLLLVLTHSIFTHSLWPIGTRSYSHTLANGHALIHTHGTHSYAGQWLLLGFTLHLPVWGGTGAVLLTPAPCDPGMASPSPTRSRRAGQS